VQLFTGRKVQATMNYSIVSNVMGFTADLKQTIRQEMENNRHCNDKQRIRFLISEGLERLKRLDEMLDMQGHSQWT
jgi:hypothetical protein